MFAINSAPAGRFNIIYFVCVFVEIKLLMDSTEAAAIFGLSKWLLSPRKTVRAQNLE